MIIFGKQEAQSLFTRDPFLTSLLMNYLSQQMKHNYCCSISKVKSGLLVLLSFKQGLYTVKGDQKLDVFDRLVLLTLFLSMVSVVGSLIHFGGQIVLHFLKIHLLHTFQRILIYHSSY